MEQILQIKAAVWHNCNYVIESVTAWLLVGFGHVVGMTVEEPTIIHILPYVQLVSLTLASAASIYTIYKIRKDLKK